MRSTRTHYFEPLGDVAMFTLGRKLDFRYKPNLIIILFVLITTAVGWLSTGQILSGIYLGGGVFMTWALCRELDPAHDYSAFIAAALSLFIIIDSESIQFLNLFWLLLMLRAVNGIIGKELTLFDLFSILGFTVFQSLNNENSIYLLIFVLGMVCIRQTREKTKTVSLAGALGLVLFILQSFFMNSLTFNNIEDFNILNILVIISSALSPIVFWFLSHIDTEDDKGNIAARSKIFASQLLYSVSILLFVFFSDITFANQVIYLSVIIGVFLYFFGMKIFRHK